MEVIVKKECEVCGVSFNAAKSKIRTCSVKCGGIIRRTGSRGVSRDCPVCGVEYVADPVRLKHGRQTTCSRACSYTLRSSERLKREACVCAVCGDEFSRAPSEVKSKHGNVFCSRTCHYSGRTLGLVRPAGEAYNHTRDGIIAQRKAGALAYASGESLQWPEIEHEIAQTLRDAGHVVIQQHIVSDGAHFWPVDIFVPALLAIIEIDGDFHRKECTAERDRMVDTTCAKQGLKVFRIPDGAPSDVRKAVFAALSG